MIKALSPHYITTPFVTPGGGLFPEGTICSKYELEIFIWTGNKFTDVPVEETYSITINNPTSSDGDSTINISRLIQDYIDFTPVESASTSLEDSPNQIWVRTQVKYWVLTYFIDFAFHKNTQIAVQGYGYGLSGENPDLPANKILLDTSIDYTMSTATTNGHFIVPIQLDEATPPVPSIVIDNLVQDGTTLDATLTFTAIGTYEEFYCIVVNVTTMLSEIITVPALTSPDTIVFSDYGEWNVTMYGYDQGTNATIESNTFNITLTA